jgi:hypothetical protein
LTADGPAVRIISPPIPVPTGQLVEISGWARVVSAERKSTVLEIEDSLGGSELSLHMAVNDTWSPFRMLRVGAKRELRIAFGLVGSGSAEIDSVEVRPLQPPLARRLPRTHAESGAVTPR